ncbi:hypothetical protein MSG28_009945 [Choristoneura fumiferana]|uniref:Uncharacterized protein n=1 Tax=Choristoneura fumiferana TaxID=7141 RepID=A0ACC0JD26_CHOFU|nr:hypothetical protein MSG28_009945 [Choristoneura fumiferana]
MPRKESLPSVVGVEHGEKKAAVDLDTILVEELGQFGWYQARTVALAALVVIFGSIASSEYVFTTARISTRCLIPECETPEQPDGFSPSWLPNAVPPSGSSFDNCRRFANASGAVAEPGTCPAILFDRNRQVDCEEYVYENTDTVVYDFDLACEEWLRSLIGSVHTFGTLTALPITGYVSDRWGRRTALGINAFSRACFGLIRSWVNSYVGFTVLQFLEATFGSGIFSCAYILVMELLGPKLRVAGGATMNTFFSVGSICAGLLAWAVNDWRRLTQVMYSPMFITIFSFWLLPESIRWYMSKGRYGESEAVLKKAAKVNGKQLSEKSLIALRESAEKEKIRKELEEVERANEPWLIVQVFRHKQILIRCVVSPVWWVANTLIYHGLSIISVNISGNRYVNYVAVSAVEIPGYWTAVLLLGKIGRKPVLIVAFWLCAACQIAYIFMPDGYYGLSLTVYLIGKFFSAMVMTSVYVYTAELYPTKYRHSLFAFSSMVGRIGSILAPLTPALGASTWEQLPFALFAGFALLSGALVFITPETLGAKFPDTMEEAEDIGRKK